MVVEGEVGREPPPGVPRARIIMEIHLFIFDTPPQPLGDNVVQGPAFAVHTDADLLVQEHRRVLGARKVTPLVVVPNRGGRQGERPLRGHQHKGEL